MPMSETMWAADRNVPSPPIDRTRSVSGRTSLLLRISYTEQEAASRSERSPVTEGSSRNPSFRMK